MQSSTKSTQSTNVLVYIPRVDARFTERDILDVIYNSNIGRATYADITAVKDNAKHAGPEPDTVFYSAFVMITNWNPAALADLKKNGQIKAWIDSNRTAYWVLRPANEGSEIPRSKVNTHQLAHYTSELYKRMDAAEKKVEDQAKIIEDQNERIAHMLETMERMLASNEEMANKLAKTSLVVEYMDAFMTQSFQREPENAVLGDHLPRVEDRLHGIVNLDVD